MPVMVTDTPAKVSYLWSLQCTTSAYNLYWWERKRKGYYSPLLLSPFSRVRLCGTPETAAHQAPPSLGFSRQEHWSGLPSPSPMHESEREVAQLCPTLSDPMDCSPEGSSIHGIFQARVLEWGAIAFSILKLSGCHIGFYFFAYTIYFIN